ncbi:translation initiation factor eIF-2B subunit epsilon [Populus alba x Populus x berolinensis]|nr:translation initiation factor eIF-2B subunit epsilon [Populus alba x Populus x berolinensis]KAJ6917846.1 translation initiation factor eIF-2B subunit epsilon [Populus alba x Populus x berolinensis]KAJ6918381.1 translation initiation factor eIF-2B subunit epsilon [Populus alba x Populus x berolinensis]
MPPQRKGAAARVSEDTEDLTRHPLQAILLADSFATKFRPITLERPKVLLPLVNVPMIDYTLAWLESAGVEEVFVFCCAHSKQVIEYLEKSEWISQPNFSVVTIESHNSVSAGDALRLIYERNVITGDFVLISGDTVSNMSLTQVIQEHKERRKKDSNAVMTMVIKQSKLSPITHQSRLGTDELFLAIDPQTKQLLFYEEKNDNLRGIIPLDNALLGDNPSICLHNDKQDCYIDICSQEVLSLFTDNFDYQHLRRHFVKGLLVDDIMGYKIFTHEIHSSYAARIDNYRSYDTISKDIIQRWTYPFVPDVMFSGNSATHLEREGMYRASEIEQSRSAHIGPFTVIGKGTRIGNNSNISNSVIGKGCSIGSNVSITGSYIWDSVTIEDGCDIRHAIICDGVVIKSGAVLEPGVVLSFKVVIGQQFIVPSYSKVSLYQQPTVEDSDEELEYADNSSGTVDSSITCTMDTLNREMMSETPASQLGPGGVGHVWSICEGGHEEEWRHSVAPIPADKLAEATQSLEDDLEFLNLDGNALSTSGELKPGRNGTDSEDDDAEDSRDDSIYYEKEVEATFLRAVNENIKVPDVILEMNSLRLSYNMTSADCAGAIFYAMMKQALEIPHATAGELRKNAASIIDAWNNLLKFYSKEIDDQIEVIMKFEEMCLESVKEFSPHFSQILHILYDKDILEEDAILRWADEKKDAEESDKVFVKQSEKLIQWLREASEEED